MVATGILQGQSSPQQHGGALILLLLLCCVLLTVFIDSGLPVQTACFFWGSHHVLGDCTRLTVSQRAVSFAEYPGPAVYITDWKVAHTLETFPSIFSNVSEEGNTHNVTLLYRRDLFIPLFVDESVGVFALSVPCAAYHAWYARRKARPKAKRVSCRWLSRQSRWLCRLRSVIVRRSCWIRDLFILLCCSWIEV